MLETAQRLLIEMSSLPRVGETVAYCLREAMTGISSTEGFDSAAEGRHGRLKRVSREVVDAADRYRGSPLPGEDSKAALDDLLSRISDLRESHDDGGGVNRERLIANMMRRLGAAPLAAGTGPVRAYVRLLERLNKALHGSCSLEAARGLWSECVAILTQLFAPPELRQSELVNLARKADPTGADLDSVRGLAVTPQHFKAFMSEVQSPSWLRLIAQSDMLDSVSVDPLAAVCSTAIRLSEVHRAAIVALLSDLSTDHIENQERTRQIAFAAGRIGGESMQFVLVSLGRYPSDQNIVFGASRAMREADATDEIVLAFFDILMNETCWPHLIVHDQVLDHFVDGVTEHNSVDRIVLLCQKLRAMAGNRDPFLDGFQFRHAGTVTDPAGVWSQERSAMLWDSLTAVLRRSWEWLSVEELLSFVEQFPEFLKWRLRAWILAYAPAAESELLVDEVESAIASREATGDDIALLDRALRQGVDRDAIESSWRRALGEPPTVEQVGQLLRRQDHPPDDWFRALSWASLLPPPVSAPWDGVCAILGRRYGQPNRDTLLRHESVEIWSPESPIDAATLESMSPQQAAETIATWRSDASNYRVSAQELGRVLQTIVKSNPDAWFEDPLHIATALYHPTYIGHYLYAATTLVADRTLPIEGLLDVIDLVRTEPWQVQSLGQRNLEYDSTWDGAHRAAIDLISALCKAGCDFGELPERVWNIVLAAATNRTEPALYTDADDHYARAINRTCTRALETALVLAHSDIRASRPLRIELIELLDYALRVEGSTGAEYRAILARDIGFIRHILPDWTERNQVLLFGDAAPDDLGQETFDLVIRLRNPDKWILESFREKVFDAATRQVERSVYHLTVGMLNECRGYEMPNIETLLRDHPTLTTEIAEEIGRLLSDDTADPNYVNVAIRYWDTVLDSESDLPLDGFRVFARISTIEESKWAQLTEKTVTATRRSTRWNEQIIERVMTKPATPPTLRILNEIVRGSHEEWTLRHISDFAKEYFDSAQSLKSTDEYKRLRAALTERGVLG